MADDDKKEILYFQFSPVGAELVDRYQVHCHEVIAKHLSNPEFYRGGSVPELETNLDRFIEVCNKSDLDSVVFAVNCHGLSPNAVGNALAGSFVESLVVGDPVLWTYHTLWNGVNITLDGHSKMRFAGLRFYLKKLTGKDIHVVLSQCYGGFMAAQLQEISDLENVTFWGSFDQTWRVYTQGGTVATHVYHRELSVAVRHIAGVHATDCVVDGLGILSHPGLGEAFDALPDGRDDLNIFFDEDDMSSVEFSGAVNATEAVAVYAEDEGDACHENMQFAKIALLPVQFDPFGDRVLPDTNGCVMQSFGSSDVLNCALCLDSIRNGELVFMLPCEHVYHLECWLTYERHQLINTLEPLCPMCRANSGFVWQWLATQNLAWAGGVERFHTGS